MNDEVTGSIPVNGSLKVNSNLMEGFSSFSTEYNKEASKSLRDQLKGIETPLAKMVEGMSDEMIGKIDSAFNMVGEGFGIFVFAEKDEDAKQIFEQLVELASIDEPKKIKEMAKLICSKINSL